MIPGLDGIRAIAFLLVFLLHTDYLYVGWVGVQLFFVLSGFLITNILLDMKEKFAAKDYFIKFYGRRLLRIFPLYYWFLLVMTIVTAILLAMNYRVNYMTRFQEHLPYAILYVYNFFNASAAYIGESWLIGHVWSLSVEEQFYIAWPLVILLTPKQHLKTLFFATVILGPVFRIALTYIYRAGLFPFLSNDMPISVYVLPFSHVDAFGFGALITRIEIPKARPQFFGLLLLLPVLGFASAYLSTGDIGVVSALGFQHPLANSLKQIWGYSYLNYLFALFIYIVAREKAFLGLLEMRFMRYLGKISYGLYVYHFPVVWFTARIRDFIQMDEVLARFLTLILSSVLLLLIASASYRWFEKPILDLKDRFFSVKTT